MNEKEKYIHTMYISHCRGIKEGLYVLLIYLQVSNREHGITRAKSFLSLIFYVLGGGDLYDGISYTNVLLRFSSYRVLLAAVFGPVFLFIF